MKFIRFAAICFVSIALSSCSKKVTTVSPVNEVSTISSKGLIYTLPTITLEVVFTAHYQQFVAGPYASYAKKYLGIEGVATQNSGQWTIASLHLNERTEPDVNALFVAEPHPKTSINFLEMSNKGLIIPIGNASFPSSGMLQGAVSPDGVGVPFTDLSVSPFIAEKRSTHYTRVFKDSTFVRVPVHRDLVVEANIEEKAKEAADFIFQLRKRRLELISGDIDFLCEGKGIQEVFDEINRLEEEYLSLFVGKHYEKQQVISVPYKPLQDKNGATILCRFSKTKGIVPASDLSGSPILVDLIPTAQWRDISLLSQLEEEATKQKRDLLYYRIPVPVTVKISDSSGELHSSTVNMHQFGPLLRVPTDFFAQ